MLPEFRGDMWCSLVNLVEDVFPHPTDTLRGDDPYLVEFHRENDSGGSWWNIGVGIVGWIGEFEGGSGVEWMVTPGGDQITG